MLTDGLQLLGSSNATNFSIEVGANFPVANAGELFFKTGSGLHVYDGETWVKVGANAELSSSAIVAALGYTPAGLQNGKLDITQIPAIAITDTFVVANQAGMLALTAEVGDIAVRTDVHKSFILKTDGASTLANWQELLNPTSDVTSVNGQTGTVVLTSSNVSEGTNQYFTNARARSAISVTGAGGSYDSATGVVTIAPASASNFTLTNGAGGSGQVQFNSSGVLTGSAKFIWNDTSNILSLGSGSVSSLQAATNGTLSVNAGSSTTTAVGGPIVFSAGTSTGGNGGYLQFRTAVGNGSAYLDRLVITNTGEWKLGGATGTAGQVLTSGGIGAAPTWTTIVDNGGDAGTLTGTTLAANVVNASINNLTQTGPGTITNGTSAVNWAFGTAAAPAGVTLTVPTSSAFVVPGAITIAGGTSTNGSVSAGGAVNIVAGNSPGIGGAVNINGGNNTGGSGQYGGHVVISGGLSNGSGFGGNVIFFTASNNVLVERFRIQSNGAWTLGGISNYGTSGQVLTSNGNAPPTWVTPTAPVAAAGTLTGNTLASNVVTASLTSIDSGQLVVQSSAGSSGTLIIGAANNSSVNVIRAQDNNSCNLLVRAGSAGNGGGNLTLSGGPGSTAVGGAIIFTTYPAATAVERFRIGYFGSWALAGNEGTSGQVLTSAGPSAPPTWVTPSAAAAAAGTLTGTTLAANVVSSSLNTFTSSTVSFTGTGTQTINLGSASVNPTNITMASVGGTTVPGALNITGALQTGTAIGGQVNLNGGSSTTSTGGHIFISAGNTAAGSGNYGGNVIISAGYAGTTGNGGHLIFNTATSTTLTERFRIQSTGAWAFGGINNFGTAGQILQSNGDAPPSWVAATAAAANALTGTTLATNVTTASISSITDSLRIGTAGLLSARLILPNTGNAAGPTMTYNGDATTGYYATSGPVGLAMAISGGQKFLLTSALAQFTPQIDAVSGILNSGGTATLPSYSFRGNNAAVGMFSATTNVLGFSTAGVQRMSLTATGGLSFGTTDTAVGTAGQVLQSNGNTPPSWATPSAGPASSLTGTTLAANVVTASLTSIVPATSTTTTVPSLAIAGGDSTGTANGGNVNITGGYSGATPGGNVTITGGGTGGTGLAGSITLAAGTSSNTGLGGSLVFRTGPTNSLLTRLTITNTGAFSFGTSATAFGNAGQVLQSNGNAAPTWSAIPYDIGFSVIGRPAASTAIGRYAANRAFTIPVNFAGSAAPAAGTAATASVVYSVQKNGVQFGTITYGTGASTGTGVAASATSFAAGDVLSIVAPSTVDVTHADFAITLAGVL